MPDTNSRAIYTVDWSGQGYDQLIGQMREFLNLKRQVDAAMKQGMGSASGRAEQLRVMRGGQAGAAPSGGTYTQQPLIAQRELDRQARENKRAQDAAQRETDRQTRERQRQHAALQAEQQREEDRQARQHDQERLRQQRTATQQAQATPSIFGDFTGALPTTDKGWIERQKNMAKLQEEALNTGKDLNSADRKLLGATNSRVALLQRRKMVEEAANPLNKFVNFAGWMLPGQAYYAQMALGESGLGLSMPFMAGALGIGALGALGLGINSNLASQTQMAMMLAGISNTGGGAVPGPADQTFGQQISNAALGYYVTRDKAMQLLPIIGGYNITSKPAIADVLTGGLTRAVNGQLTNEQGVQLQSLITGRLYGGDTDKARIAIEKLDEAITATGANANATYKDILALGDTLTPGTNLTDFATLNAGLAGTGQTASQVFGNVLSVSGLQRVQTASLMQGYGAIPSGVNAAAYLQNLQENDKTGAALAQQTFYRNVLASVGDLSIAEAITGAPTDQAFRAVLNYVPPKPVTYLGPPAPPASVLAASKARDAAAKAALTSGTPLPTKVGTAGFQSAGDVLGAYWSNSPFNPGYWSSGAAMSNLLDPQHGLGVLGPGFSQLGTWASALLGTGTPQTGQEVKYSFDITIRDANGTVLDRQQIKGATTQTPTVTPGPGAPSNVQVVPSTTPTPTSTTGQ